MGRRHRKIRILDLAIRDDANNDWFYEKLMKRRETAAMLPDLLGTAPVIPIIKPPVVVIADTLPIYSADEQYMGDLVDGVYHCFEMVDGVYVSHFTCDDYDRLKKHMMFVHGILVIGDQ